MALVKCKNCGYKGSVGVMPTSTCGMLLFPAMGLGGIVAVQIVAKTAHLHTVYKIALAILAFIIVFIVGIYLIHVIPYSFEWLLAMCHKCPECKKRKWSFPFTEGAGL